MTLAGKQQLMQDVNKTKHVHACKCVPRMVGSYCSVKPCKLGFFWDLDMGG